MVAGSSESKVTSTGSSNHSVSEMLVEVTGAWVSSPKALTTYSRPYMPLANSIAW